MHSNRHDFILAYNQEYDDMLHRTTPYSEEAIRALRNHVSAFDRIVRAVEDHWKGYDRLIMFTPDHGAHINVATGKGTHGEDIPEDMLVNHFFGVGSRGES